VQKNEIGYRFRSCEEEKASKTKNCAPDFLVYKVAKLGAPEQ
jgi:hypothetical protein